jgi:protein-S-isoprenylcysteine O-methyltransferase Ste14
MTTKKHANNPELTGEHAWGDAGQIILFFIFLLVWIADSFFLDYSILRLEFLSLAVKLIVAAVIFILSGSLASKGLKIVFGEKREKPEVIKKGPFSFVRHPVYLAAILLYLGFLVISFSLLSALVWLVIITFYFCIARYEERILTKEFGKEYLQYKREVPMLFPLRLRYK